MDILDSSLLLVVEKVRAWIHWKDTFPECSAASCELYGDCGVCSQCNSRFDAVDQHYRCSICGMLFCLRCVQIDTVSVTSNCETREPLRSKEVNSFCIPCFTQAEQESIVQKLDENLPMGARNDVVGYTALEGHPKANPLSVPYDAPSSNANRQDGLPQEQKCSLNPLNVSSILSPSKVLSPVSLQCSIRSDHGHGPCNLIDADDAGLNYLTPRSEYYQDYDTDSNSSFNRNDVYSFRSANSSPFDSPVTASSTPERVYSPTPDSQTECPTYQDSSRLIQEKMEIASRSNEDAEQTTYAFHMNDSSIINQGHTQKIELILDLEYNDIIWFPPKENAQDEIESITFESDDEDVDGYCSMLPSIDIEPDSQVNQERLNDLHKEPPLDVIHGHFKALVSQLLRGVGIGAESNGVYDKWLEIVTLLASQAAKFIKPDTSGGGSMDPCDYVKVKCIASGNPTESTLIKGVVCTTKIKHKRMISQCRNPKLLLLRGALEYQRLPDQLSSIGTLLDEEKDYLKAKVSKIEAYGPNVLLVEKSVSPCAQEYLLAKDISLMLNVKRSILERIARCTGAQIIPSIDSLTSPRLGYCDVFRIERVVEQCQTTENPNKKSNKTLMFFEGCPKHLGCTVLLRGASHECLKKIKQVVQYAVFAAYHLSLETSFFADEGASLPHLPAEPLDTSPVNLSKLDRAISMVPKSVINTYNDMVTSQTLIPPNNLTSPKLELSQSRRRPSFDLENEDIQSPHERADPITLFPLSPTLLGTTTFSHLVTTDSLNSLTAPNNSNGSQCKESNNLTMPSSGDTSMVGMHERTLSEEEGALNLQREINITQEKTNLHAINPLKEPVRTVDAHQGIIVLFFSRCMTTDTVCERPQLLRVKFYGSSDKPLGKFLGDNLFNQTVHCRSCNESTEAHVQFYIHQQGSLTIWVKQTPWKLPGAHEGKIWMWHRCCKCEPKDRISPTKKKMMSDAAWGLSFGKFLELSFSNSENANRVAPCGHSMQRDCLRYYG